MTRSSCLHCVSDCDQLPSPPLSTWRSSPPYPVLSPSPRRCRPSRNMRHFISYLRSAARPPSLDSHSPLLTPGIPGLPPPSISSPASPTYPNQHRPGPGPHISSRAASSGHNRNIANIYRFMIVSLIHLTSHVIHF